MGSLVVALHLWIRMFVMLLTLGAKALPHTHSARYNITVNCEADTTPKVIIIQWSTLQRRYHSSGMKRHMMAHWDLGPYTEYVCCGIVQGFATKQTGQAMPVESFSIVLHMDCGHDTCAHQKVFYSRSPHSWLDLHNYYPLVCFWKFPCLCHANQFWNRQLYLTRIQESRMLQYKFLNLLPPGTQY